MTVCLSRDEYSQTLTTSSSKTHEMPDYELYIGDARDASDHEKIENRDVDSVLKLTHNGNKDGYPESVDIHEHRMTPKSSDRPSKPYRNSLKKKRRSSYTVMRVAQEVPLFRQRHSHYMKK